MLAWRSEVLAWCFLNAIFSQYCLFRVVVCQEPGLPGPLPPHCSGVTVPKHRLAREDILREGGESEVYWKNRRKWLLTELCKDGKDDARWAAAKPGAEVLQWETITVITHMNVALVISLKLSLFYTPFLNYYNLVFLIILCLTQQFPRLSLSTTFIPISFSFPFVVLTFCTVLPSLLEQDAVPASTETIKLRLIPREHCHCTCSVWQAPDDADWMQPLFQVSPLDGLWYVFISATCWEHSIYTRSRKTFPSTSCNLFNFSLLFFAQNFFLQEVGRTFTPFNPQQLDHLTCKLSGGMGVTTS